MRCSLIPAALTYTFGKMVKDTRQGWAVLARDVRRVSSAALLVRHARARRQSRVRGAARRSDRSACTGGTWKARRCASASRARPLRDRDDGRLVRRASTAMHDSFTPLGGFVPLFLIQLGEVIFGGVGAGMYGMLMFAVVAVFVAGLMVGRTPEYIGKKIEAKEMKMASLAILVPCASILIFTAIAVATEAGRKGPLNPGPHGSARSSTRSRRPRATTAARSPGSPGTRPSTTRRSASRCSSGASSSRFPCSRSPERSRRRRSSRPARERCPRTRRSSSRCSSASSSIVGALTFIPALALGPFVEQLLAKA